MSVLDTLKEWYSLEDAAKRLSKVFDDEVNEKDVLRFCSNGFLNLSVILRNTKVIAPLKYCPLPNSFYFIYRAAEHVGDLECLLDLSYGLIRGDGGDGRFDDDLDRCFSDHVQLSKLGSIIHREPIDYSRVEEIREIAEYLYLEARESPYPLESSLPEYVYIAEGQTELHITEQIEINHFDGVYQIVLNELQCEALLDKYVICDEELLTEDYELEEWVILDNIGNKYTPIFYNIGNGGYCPYSSCYNFKRGIPPVKALVIQTKHLLEFEKGFQSNSKKAETAKKTLISDTARPNIDDFIINPNTNKTDQYLEVVDCIKAYISKNNSFPDARKAWALYEVMGFKLLSREGFNKIFSRITNPKKK